MKKTTVYDVAKKTGFSRSTVYAALNNTRHVSKKTAEKIRLQAFKMGYIVDPLFSEMGKYRWKNSTKFVGANILFFSEKGNLEGNSRKIQALKTYAQSKGYGLSFRTPSRFQSIEHANRIMKTRGIRGVATNLLTTRKSQKFVLSLDLKDIAVLTGEINDTLFHSLSWNWSSIVTQCIMELVDRGYKKIALFISADTPLRFYDHQRIGTILSLQKILPVTITLDLYPAKETSPEKGETAFIKKLRSVIKKNKPDALIGWSERDYWHLKNAGIKIPDDLGYVSFIATPTCSGMSTPIEELWKIQLDRLIELIRNQEFGSVETPITSLYTPEFVDHGTA